LPSIASRRWLAGSPFNFGGIAAKSLFVLERPDGPIGWSVDVLALPNTHDEILGVSPIGLLINYATPQLSGPVLAGPWTPLTIRFKLITK
jgi:hypothetical protein